MSAATFRRAKFSEILLLVRAYLVTYTGLEDQRVIVTALTADETPLFRGTQDILLRPLEEDPRGEIVDGSGRLDRRSVRHFEVAIRTRVMLDKSGEDVTRLTNESLGHMRLEDVVCDALELYHVEDAARNVLAAPLRVGRLTAPQKIRDAKGWVYSAYKVETEYRRDLDLKNLRY